MKKFIINTTTIIINKEKFNVINLQSSRDEKYILYSGKNIKNENIDNNIFIKFEFNENINITPKKKLNELNLSIVNNNNLYSLNWYNNPVFYLKNSKNILINDIYLQFILSNGLLYKILDNKQLSNNTKEIDINIDFSKKEKNIINDLLNKNKKTNILNNDLTLLPDDTNIKPSIQKISSYDVELQEKSIQEPFVHNVEVQEQLSEENVVKNVELKEQLSEENVVKNVELKEQLSEENVVKNIELKEQPSEENVVKNVELKEQPSEENVVKNVELKEQPSEENVVKNVELNKKPIIDNIDNIDDTKNINYKTNILNNFEIEKLDKIKNISNIINEEKFDLDNKKIELENNVFNLENVLMDFNKLFKSFDNENSIENSIKISNINMNTNKEILVKSNLYNKIINKEYITKIQYLNSSYKLNTIKLSQSNDLNFLNLYNYQVINDNIINKSNLSFELDNVNSSYLIIFFNQKYLINKINNTIILTQLLNKKSLIIKNKDTFKIGIFDYMLYNEGTLIIPMINKKIYDNNYGTTFNMYIPKN
jgi:hypothetical protein